MKNFIKAIGTILLIPLLLILIQFYLNRQVVDVRYTLSENIPINLSTQSSSESVQQLTVKNLGNAKAEKIVVNIQGKINSYDLIKYSEVDKVDTVKKNEGIQLVYSELPTDGRFKVVIRSEGTGLKTNDITISHNKGEAKEALSSDSSKSGWERALVWIIYVLLFLVYSIRGSLIDNLQRKSRYLGDYKEILNKKGSPFYLNENKWNEIRQVALKTMINESCKFYSYEKIHESKCYNILSKDKPEYLKESEWESVLKELTKSIEEGIGGRISNIFYKIGDSINILELEKPKSLNKDTWNDIRKNILTKMKVVLQDNSFTGIYDKDVDELEVYKMLDNDKPKYLSEDEWNYLSSELIKILNNTIKYRASNISYDCEKLLKLINIKRPNKYSATKWDDFMKQFHDKYITMNMKKAMENELYLNNEELKKTLTEEKPEAISQEYWNKYIKYLKVFYNFNVVYNIHTGKNSIEFLKQQLPEFLYVLLKLEDEAYKMQLVDYTIEALKKDYEEFKSDEKPNWICEKDYNRIFQFLHDKNKLDTLISENNKENEILKEKKYELSIQSSNVKTLKDKVTSQLEIIDKLLLNPKSIDRIEDYEDTFSKGNFENLRKISELINNV